MKKSLDRRSLKKLATLVRTGVFRAGLRIGVAATVEHRAVPFLESPRSVLDVGAHTGQFALFARASFPAARIHCFEPQPGPVRTLQKVVDLIGNAELHPFAVGPEPRRAVMHVSTSDDSSSLLPIGERQVAAHPRSAEVRQIEIEVRPLDGELSAEDLPAPCLLKVDVQGYELEALRGCGNLLDSVQQVLVELSYVELYVGQPRATEVSAFLVAEGFELAGVFGQTADRDGLPIQADFLFERRIP